LHARIYESSKIFFGVICVSNKFNDLLDVLKIAGIYTAVIFGAGVASGQEILNFFVSHGVGGFLGVILSGTIFSFIGYAVLDICYKKKINNATVFSEMLFKKFSIIVELVVALFLFVIYSMMFSACGTMFVQEFAFPRIFGILTLAAVCYAAYSLGENFFARLNLFITPILFLGSVSMGLYIILHSEVQTFSFVPLSKNWVKGGCLYSAYNIIPGISVMVPMINTVKAKKKAKYGTILGGIFLTIITFILASAIFLNFNIAVINQIPMLAITNKFNNIYIKATYTIVFMLAMFTTAIGNFFGVCEWLNKKNIIHPKILVTVFAILFAQLKFSDFVQIIFPIFGYIGLLEIIVIMIYYFCLKKSK
jgi:uncharacterized membrane protein YkvI